MIEKRDVEKHHDDVLSRYIRMRDGGTCYCGYKNADYQDREGNNKPGWLGMYNGHLFSRSFDGTRWDEINCHCTCWKCNEEHERNEQGYKRWFIFNYGQDRYDQLQIQSHVVCNYTIEWHLEKIEELNQKIDALKKENYNL